MSREVMQMALEAWQTSAYGTVQHHKAMMVAMTEVGKAILAQTEQEPVGTLNISHFKGHLVNHDFDYFGELSDGTYSLYTSPPKCEWVGLTEAEMLHIDPDGYNEGFPQMIEANLKEKNA